MCGNCSRLCLYCLWKKHYSVSHTRSEVARENNSYHHCHRYVYLNAHVVDETMEKIISCKVECVDAKDEPSPGNCLIQGEMATSRLRPNNVMAASRLRQKHDSNGFQLNCIFCHWKNWKKSRFLVHAILSFWRHCPIQINWHPVLVRREAWAGDEQNLRNEQKTKKKKTFKPIHKGNVTQEHANFTTSIQPHDQQKLLWHNFFLSYLSSEYRTFVPLTSHKLSPRLIRSIIYLMSPVNWRFPLFAAIKSLSQVYPWKVSF